MLTQGAFGLFTLLVCSLLIVNLFAAMLAGQAREIGGHEGARRRRRPDRRDVLGFARCCSACSHRWSRCRLRIAIGRPYAALKADMLNFPTSGIAIPWWAIALQIAVAAAAGGRGVHSGAPGVPAAGRHGLRDTGIAASDGRSYLRRRIAHRGISRPLLLSLGNAFRSRQRMLLTLLALAAAARFFSAADNLRSAVRDSVDRCSRASTTTSCCDSTTAYRRAPRERSGRGTWRALTRAGHPGASASVLHADGMSGDAFSARRAAADSTHVRAAVEQGRGLTRRPQRARRSAVPAARRAVARAWRRRDAARSTASRRNGTVVGVVDARSAADRVRAARDAARLAWRRSCRTLAVATRTRTAPRAARHDPAPARRARAAGMPVASSQLPRKAARASKTTC